MFAATLALLLSAPPAEEYAALAAGFQKRADEFTVAVQAAPSDVARVQVHKDKYPDPAPVAVKMRALADAHPTDPAAVDALLWIVTHAAPTARDAALDTLLKKYLASEKLLVLVPSLQNNANEPALRELRATSPAAKVQAAAALALSTLVKARAESAGDREGAAEALRFAEDAKAKGEDADALLWELRELGLGHAMPALEGESLDGPKAKLSDLKGKVVVLDIWATWCGPCRAMIPHERALVKRLEGKPFALISVSCDDQKTQLTRFLQREPMEWTHWFDGPNGPVAQRLRVQLFPTVYVLDGQGVIRFKGPRGEAMDKAVDTLLKELPEKK